MIICQDLYKMSVKRCAEKVNTSKTAWVVAGFLSKAELEITCMNYIYLRIDLIDAVGISSIPIVVFAGLNYISVSPTNVIINAIL